MATLDRRTRNNLERKIRNEEIRHRTSLETFEVILRRTSQTAVAEMSTQNE